MVSGGIRKPGMIFFIVPSPKSRITLKASVLQNSNRTLEVRTVNVDAFDHLCSSLPGTIVRMKLRRCPLGF
jgi:hypothetical protein